MPQPAMPGPLTRTLRSPCRPDHRGPYRRAWTMVNPYLEGNFAPVFEERTDDHALEVTGVVPPDLEGRLLRNGPNPVTQPVDPADYHWFSGDGMVHAISLSAGKATGYRNRWVRTRALADKVATVPPKGPSEPIDGPANTTSSATPAPRWPWSSPDSPMPSPLTSAGPGSTTSTARCPR